MLLLPKDSKKAKCQKPTKSIKTSESTVMFYQLVSLWEKKGFFTKQLVNLKDPHLYDQGCSNLDGLFSKNSDKHSSLLPS
jgi:hypothetical protein